MAAKKIAYSYVRFSRPEQLKGDSLRRQKEASKKWCEDNGYYLDDSLKLTDKGISAYRGDNAVKGKFAAFIEAVENGTVKKGSVLIVESLDRISREKIGVALTKFMDLLSKGITIVTLEPYDKFTQKDLNDTVKIVSVILVISRSNEESETKSKRVKAAWENKRYLLKQGVILSGRIPGWIEKNGNKFVFNEHVTSVKKIVRLYLDGHGTSSIARILNAENIPTIGRGKQKAKFWRQSSIVKILNSRALFGEFQPHLGKSNQDQTKRQPIGEPITGYYPAVIKEADFYRVKKLMDDKRTSIKGRHGRDGSLTNLFRGIIHDVKDDSSMIIVNKGARASGRQIVSSKSNSDSTSDYIAFPYEAFEHSILKLISKITTADILPQKGTDISDDLEDTNLKLAKIEERISKLQKQIENPDDPDELDTLLPIVTKLTKQKRETEIQIEELKQKLHSSLPTSEDCRSLTEMIQSEDNVDDNRRRFRSMFLTVVQKVEVLVQKSGHWRQAFIRLNFANGNKRIIVCNCHRGKYISSGGFDGDYPIEQMKSQKHLQLRLDQMKARSVKQTELNLDQQLIDAAIGKSGNVHITADTISYVSTAS